MYEIFLYCINIVFDGLAFVISSCYEDSMVTHYKLDRSSGTASVVSHPWIRQDTSDITRNIMAAANSVLTHTGPDTQKLVGPAATSDAKTKQAKQAKELEGINHESETKV